MGPSTENPDSPRRRPSTAWIDADGRRPAGRPAPGAAHRDGSHRRIHSKHASIVLRRFGGALVDELRVHCRPADGISDVARQTEAVYEALVETLASIGVGPDALVGETLFLRRIREDAEAARRARVRVLGSVGLHATRAATTFVGQPPLGADADVELSAVVVVPRPGTAASRREVRGVSACSCATCAPGPRATVLRLGDETHVYAANVHGSGRDAAEEAYDMFRVAEGMLAEAGLCFRDVVRTWIHVRNIDRDYAALNRARRAFFRDRGVRRRPASTGVQGIPVAGAHDFSLSFQALACARPLDVAAMSTPLLNEAWTYGADFSRGLAITGASATTLWISGTASIDEAGRTVHVGDFAAQADRMLDNVDSLLAGHGASVADVVSSVTYLARPSDAPALRALYRRRGFDRFPCPVVEAPLCRPDLLCETEAVALLPLATA